MTALTKIFVVLLVIVSILQSAATVVWVNKIQPLQAQLDAARNSQQAAEAQANSAQQNAEKALSEAATVRGNLTQQKQDDAALLTNIQNQLSAAQVSIAQLQQEKAGRDGNIASLQASLQLATSANTKYQTQVKELRDTNDNLTRTRAQQDQRIDELTAQTETLRAHLEDLTQKYTVAQADETKLKGALQSKGVDPDTVLNGTGPAIAMTPINGTVKDILPFNGNTYVTISVGQQDSVAKGMQFYVIDTQRGGVLGIMTVDQVSTDDATGKVRGDADKVKLIQKGDDVKTQVR